MNSDGSGARQLTSGPALDEVPSWSPDGKVIVFERHPDAGLAEDADLFTVSPEGKHIVRLTHNAHARNPAWSPDGTKIAFWADSAGDPIEILEVSTGKLTMLIKADETTSVGTLLLLGEPAGALTSHASEDGYELLVIGRRGRGASKAPPQVDCISTWRAVGPPTLIVRRHHMRRPATHASARDSATKLASTRTIRTGV
jgi:dipeptidyl aminopeptidase/acylaminoacyl peptidase